MSSEPDMTSDTLHSPTQTDSPPDQFPALEGCSDLFEELTQKLKSVGTAVRTQSIAAISPNEGINSVSDSELKVAEQQARDYKAQLEEKIVLLSKAEQELVAANAREKALQERESSEPILTAKAIA